MHQESDHVPAVLDASFWINVVRTGTVSYLTDYFSLTTAPRVATELTALLGLPRPPEAAVLFQEWQHRGLIKIATPRQTVERFDAGENEAIALAQEGGSLLLIDNSAPRDWSRGDTPAQVGA